MSEDTGAVLITICSMAILIVWAPCLSLLTGQWRRYRTSSPAPAQSRELPATAERVEIRDETANDEGAGFGWTALH
jgi:hypothetical protein